MLAENLVSDNPITSAVRFNSAPNEWNSSQFFHKNIIMFSRMRKKNLTWDLTTLLKVEVVKYSEFSTLLLLNSTAIVGAYAESNIWSKPEDDMITTSISFLLLRKCSMTSSISKMGSRIILFPLMRSEIFSFIGQVTSKQLASCQEMMGDR